MLKDIIEASNNDYKKLKKTLLSALELTTEQYQIIKKDVLLEKNFTETEQKEIIEDLENILKILKNNFDIDGAQTIDFLEKNKAINDIVIQAIQLLDKTLTLHKKLTIKFKL